MENTRSGVEKKISDILSSIGNETRRKLLVVISSKGSATFTGLM